MTITYMSQKGYDKLIEDIKYLQRVRRREIAHDLEVARSHGDLKENAEYDAAKDAQAMNELRISKLAEKLAESRVLDDRDIPKDKAYLGATVKLKDLNDGEEIAYMLVAEIEADFLEDKISVTSPIGKGLLGHGIDEEVEIEVPAGILKYKILDITR
ncbi:transcription elongation factor GreA [candidate division KSB1 bacterium]|nr:transcription elongation factor GreA [candidate division KSB1 bacterium]